MAAALTTDQMKELHAWLLTKGVVLNNLGQRFADGTEFARLMKSMFPRRVDLHNYSTCSSTAAKVDNWDTLNFKVLTKLQLKLTKSNIEELAKGMTSAVEGLLFRVMTLEKNNNEAALKKSSLALRTIGRQKSTHNLDKASAHYKSNDSLAAAYKDDPPADEQQIIAELCKELNIEMPKNDF